MKSGTVKIYNRDKGFGFIVEEDSGDEYFVNAADLHPKMQGRPLREGQKVKFDIRSDMKGDKAVNVRPG
ncbi:MAG: cold shock domain-containing protein [Calditrichaeota bacterium]|nr:MAG: cold shock domain-containing protein [Calditrichota bacterium]